MLTAALVFGATYVVLALGGLPGLRLDRAGAAVVGAAAMLALGVVGPEAAYRMVDLGTLVLLFGMMVVVAHLRLAGFFRWTAAAVAGRARSPRQLLAGLVFVAGGLSALFVNDTVCLALTPLVLEVAETLGVRPLPYLLALATASNLGSVATLTGNPQNMLVGAASGMAYASFFRALAPVAAVGLALDFGVIAWIHRREMAQPFRAPAQPRVRVHAFLMAKAIVVSLAMRGFFFAGAPIAVVALAAGAALLVTRRVKPEKVFRAVDWTLLVLFAGLFVVVGAARVAGVSDRIFLVLHAGQARSVAALALVATVLSNLVSNVPAVMLFTPLVPSLPDPVRAWLVLAMSSTLAGNLTLLGSIANLIVAEGARRTEPISFADYLRVGVPVTVLSLLAGVLILARS